MKTALACLLIAAVVTAMPADDMVPESDPAMPEGTTTAADNMDLHNEAKATVTDMMQSGKTAGACGSLADSTIKEIDTSVNAAQKTLDVLPSGAACAKENK